MAGKLARSSTEELNKEMENRADQKELTAGKWVFNWPKYKAMNPKNNAPRKRLAVLTVKWSDRLVVLCAARAADGGRSSEMTARLP
jgi:hypothetical protein